jgi:hypothetical protein
MRLYTRSRLEPVALPALERDDVWNDPLVAAAADRDLRADLRELTRRLPRLLDLLDRLPQVPTHGDACPQNLLVSADEPSGFVVIDWAMAACGAVGEDLGQLVIGLANDGRLDVTDLPVVRAAVVGAFADGLADESIAADETRCGSASTLDWWCAAPSPPCRSTTLACRRSTTSSDRWRSGSI